MTYYREKLFIEYFYSSITEIFLLQYLIKYFYQNIVNMLPDTNKPNLYTEAMVKSDMRWRNIFPLDQEVLDNSGYGMLFLNDPISEP